MGFQTRSTLAENTVNEVEKTIAEYHFGGIVDTAADQTTGMTDRYFAGHHLLSRQFSEADARRLLKLLASRARRVLQDSSAGQLQAGLGATDGPETQEPYDVHVHVSDDASDDELDLYDGQHEEAADL